MGASFWRRIFQRKAIPGWIVVLAPWVYRAIDAWGNFEFARSKVPSLLHFLLTPGGQLVVTVAGLGLLYVSIREKPLAAEPGSQPEVVAQQPDRTLEGLTWRDYKRDTIDGLLWVWRWNYILPETADNEDIGRFAHALIPRCPNCKANLDIRLEELTCPNGHVRKILPPAYDHDSYQPYSERIATEIVRRVESGEYKETLKQK